VNIGGLSVGVNDIWMKRYVFPHFQPICLIRLDIKHDENERKNLKCPVMQIPGFHGKRDDCSLFDRFQMIRRFELKPYFSVFYLAVIRKMKHRDIDSVIAFGPTEKVPLQQNSAFHMVLAKVLNDMLASPSFAPRMVVVVVPGHLLSGPMKYSVC